MSNNDIPDLSVLMGKTIGRDNGDVIGVKLALEQHEHSWDLVSYNQDGTMVGVAAHGPIGSLHIIVQLLKNLGARPQRQSGELPPQLRG